MTCQLPGCDPALSVVPTGFVVTAEYAAKLIARNGEHVELSAPGPVLIDVHRSRAGLDAVRPMERVHGIARFTPATFGFTADDLTPYQP